MPESIKSQNNMLHDLDPNDIYDAHGNVAGRPSHMTDVDSLIRENNALRWKIKDFENEIDDLKRQIEFKEKSYDNYKNLME